MSVQSRTIAVWTWPRTFSRIAKAIIWTTQGWFANSDEGLSKDQDADVVSSKAMWNKATWLEFGWWQCKLHCIYPLPRWFVIEKILTWTREDRQIEAESSTDRDLCLGRAFDKLSGSTVHKSLRRRNPLSTTTALVPAQKDSRDTNHRTNRWGVSQKKTKNQ